MWNIKRISRLDNFFIYCLLTIAMFNSLFVLVVGGEGIEKILVSILIFSYLVYSIIKGKGRINMSWAIAYFVYSLIIISNGIYFDNWIRFRSAIFYYLIYPLIFFAMKRSAYYLNLNKFLNYFLICTIPNAIVGTIEYVSKKNLLSTSVLKTGADGIIRPAGLTGSFIFLPLIMVGGCLISFYFFYMGKKWYYFVIFIVDFLAMFVSMSRGPIVGFFVSMILLYWNLSKAKNNKSRVIAVMVMFFILALLALVISTDFSFNIDYFDRALVRIREILVWDGSNGDASNVVRFRRWMYFWNLFTEKPWVGYGIGSTGSAISDYQTHTMGVTESSYIKRLVETGIIGSIPFYLFCVTSFSKFIKTIKTKKNADSSLMLVISYLVAFIVEHAVLQINEMLVPNLLFWLFFGLAYSLTVQMNVGIHKSSIYSIGTTN